jgi:transposase
MPAAIRKKQHSDETRQKVISKYETGKTPSMIAEDLELEYEAVRSIIKIYKRDGRVESIKKRTPTRKKVNSEIENFIKTKIEQDVSITLKKLKNSYIPKKVWWFQNPQLTGQ